MYEIINSSIASRGGGRIIGILAIFVGFLAKVVVYLINFVGYFSQAEVRLFLYDEKLC